MESEVSCACGATNAVLLKSLCTPPRPELPETLFCFCSSVTSFWLNYQQISSYEDTSRKTADVGYFRRIFRQHHRCTSDVLSGMKSDQSSLGRCLSLVFVSAFCGFCFYAFSELAGGHEYSNVSAPKQEVKNCNRYPIWEGRRGS